MLKIIKHNQNDQTRSKWSNMIRIIKNDQTWTAMIDQYQKRSKWSDMIKMPKQDQTWSKMIEMIKTWSEIIKLIKISKIITNDQTWSKYQNDQTCSKWSNMM